MQHVSRLMELSLSHMISQIIQIYNINRKFVQIKYKVCMITFLPEMEERANMTVRPRIPPGVTVRPWRPLSPVATPLSVAPAAVLPAMGPCSPISPAASPETAAETGDGLTIAEEDSIPSPLLYVGLVSPGGWDPVFLFINYYESHRLRGVEFLFFTSHDI